MRYHPQIQTYTVLAPKWRIIYPEGSSKLPEQRYLDELDASLRLTQEEVAYRDRSDLVSLVFTNQAVTHALQSKHLAQLLSERKILAERHLLELQERLEELTRQRPFRRAYGRNRDRSEQDLERQILDLERQRRDIEVTLWRDTLELRRELVGQRQQYQATRTRMNFLAGGGDAQS